MRAVAIGTRGLHSSISRKAIAASELSSILEERVSKYYQKFDVQEVSWSSNPFCAIPALSVVVKGWSRYQLIVRLEECFPLEMESLVFTDLTASEPEKWLSFLGESKVGTRLSTRRIRGFVLIGVPSLHFPRNGAQS